MIGILKARHLQYTAVLVAAGSLLACPARVIDSVPTIIFGYFLYLTFGIAIGFHRGLSHRTLNGDHPFTWFCLYFGTLSSLGRPIEWALIHRLHHQHSDQPEDPHSPKHQGFWRILTNTWDLSHLEAGGAVKPQLVRDLFRVKPVMFFQRHYFTVIGASVFVLALFGGWPAVLFGYFWPVALTVLATSVVNSVCHIGGKPCDNTLVTWLTFGEGMHGTHHELPKKINLSRGSSFDLAGFLMAAIGGRLRALSGAD